MRKGKYGGGMLAIFTVLSMVFTVAYAQESVTSSYAPVVIKVPFQKIMARMKAAKPAIETRQTALLNERYDLSNRLAKAAVSSYAVVLHCLASFQKSLVAWST